MVEISAALVRELREKTGAGMMDCKKALAETKGDLEAAIDWLRKKGLAAAAKKAGRVASEGLVGVTTHEKNGAIVEINAETDFVSRNEQFQSFVRKVSEIALKTDNSVDSLRAAAYPGEGGTVEGELNRLISIIGENMSVRRVSCLNVKTGIVCSYIHSAIAPGLGRIGVLVALESTADEQKLLDLGKKLAMHIAAASPHALSIAEVDPANLARERDVLTEQAKASGKPAEFIEKMVEGRIRKYYEEVVLLEQTFLIDGQSRISQLIEQTGKEWGHPVKISGFVRYTLGEGIEKAQSDFASDVQAMTH